MYTKLWSGFILIMLVTGCMNNTLRNKSTYMLYPREGTIIENQDEWAKEGYFKRISEFKKEPIGENKIVFLGNSITEGGGDWSKRFNRPNIVNRGIGGDITEGVIERLPEIIYYKPLAVFLLIGINDIFNNDKPQKNENYVANKIHEIVDIVKKESPKTRVFVQTILPVNPKNYFKANGFFPDHPDVSIKEKIKKINNILKNNDQLEVINLHSAFVDKEGYLDTKYSDEGVHLNESGYTNWVNFIKNKISELN